MCPPDIASNVIFSKLNCEIPKIVFPVIKYSAVFQNILTANKDHKIITFVIFR